MTEQPRQTRLKILFGRSEADVSTEIMADLLEFSYDDKETNEAEEITIRLKDDTGRWSRNWKPSGGEVIKAWILPGDIRQAKKSLYCGKFYVDELTVSGSPRQVEIKAVSIPLNKPIRRKLKSKAWEKKSLRDIASEIAKEAGIKLLFDSKENPTYDRQEQSRESDLSFLSKLCEEAGLSVKVTDEKLVIFDQKSYESKKAIKTLEIGKSDITSWSFTASQSDTYKSCTVTYRDPKRVGKTITYTYVDPTADENGQECSIKKRAKSVDEARRLAKAKLRKLNARKVTGNIELVGDISMLGGVVVNCKGFGDIDGNFIIETASHSVSDVYTTSISLRRVNTSY